MFIDEKKKCDFCGKEFNYYFSTKDNKCTSDTHISTGNGVEGNAVPNGNGYTVEVKCPKCNTINTIEY